MATMGRGRADEAQAAHDALSNFCNAFSHNEQAFVDAFLHNHRTLQQREVELFLRCLYALAEADDEHGGDLRNEDARKAAQKVREALGEHGYALSFI